HLEHAGGFGNIFERSVVIVTEYLHRLFVARAAGDGVHLGIDVPIVHEYVHPAVVVEIYETGAPLYIAKTWLAEFRRPGHNREGATAQVPVEVVGLVSVLGHEQVELAVMIVVGEIHSHVAEFLAVTAEGHAGKHADLIEGAVVAVVVKEVGAGIVRHKQIWPAGIVVIGPDCAETIAVLWIVHSSLFGDVLEGAITAIVKQIVAGFTRHPPGAALHQHALEAAEFFVAAEGRQMVHIHVDITRDKQVHVAVAIIIAPGGAGGKAGNSAKPGLLSDILKLAMAESAIEDAVSVAG